MSGLTEVKRRSARMYAEEQEFTSQINTAKKDTTSRPTKMEEVDKVKQIESRSSSKDAKIRRQSVVDLGLDTSIFPKTEEEIEKHITATLQAAKSSCKIKEDARPINHGVVLAGKIYRSSWPKDEDFPYLESLRLKTVLSLVKDGFNPEFRDFVKKNDIAHKIIDMPGTKKTEPTKDVMQSIIDVVLNEANHPILIHCNHGKHRTGCAVAVIRHVAGWDVESIIEEYQGYAAPKVRDCDIKYITEYQVSSLQGLFVEKDIKEDIPIASQHLHEEGRPQIVPLGHDDADRPLFPLWRRRPRMTRYVMISAVALGIWITTGLFWPTRP